MKNVLMSLLIIGIVFQYSFAQTIYVSGNISSNTTWLADTVKVTATVTVENGITLTIPPGTYIEFQGDFYLEVDGTVMAQGTLNDSIIFTTLPNVNMWHGIEYQNTSNSNDTSFYKYCRLNSVFTGFNFYNYDKVELSHTMITNAFNKGVALSSANMVMEDIVLMNGSGKGFSFYASDVILRRWSVSGFSNIGGEIISCSPVWITDCLFFDNHNDYDGGGLKISNSTFTLKNSVFFNNNSQQSGAGIWYGGSYGPGDFGIIENCTFTDNHANYSGGGLKSGGNLMLINCEFNSNEAQTFYGGGFCHDGGGSQYIINCRISENYSEKFGGGIYHNGNSINIYNTTIVGNTAKVSGGGLWTTSLNLVNSILWGNVANNDTNQIFSIYSSHDIYYSDVQYGLPGIDCPNFDGNYENNISYYPGFADTANNDYRLTGNSYCINSGKPDTSGLLLPLYDLDSNLRVFNTRVDMGAYEYQDTAANRLPVVYEVPKQYTNVNEPRDVVIEYDEFDEGDTNYIHVYSDVPDMSFVLPADHSSPVTVTVVPNNDWVGTAIIYIEVMDKSGMVSAVNSTSFEIDIAYMIELCGTISADMEISADLVMVNCDIYIPENVTLTINPGVKFEFQGFYKIEVDGNIVANGSSADSIVFTPLDTIAGWKGIKYDRLYHTVYDSSVFRYCKIEYAKQPYQQGYGAFFLHNYNELRVEDCEIANCITAFNVENYSSVILKNSNLHNNSGVISGNHFCNLNIINNLIADNEGIAVGLSSSSDGLISGNTIKRNNKGVYMSSSQAQILNNVIDSNFSTSYLFPTAGIYGDWNSQAYIIGNTITNNKCVVGSTSYVVGGGAIKFWGMDLEIRDNILAGNSVDRIDQVQNKMRGGAIFIEQTNNVKIINNRIHNNKAGWGGAIYIQGKSGNNYVSDIIIQNNQITNNSAYLGGAFYLDNRADQANLIYNNSICNNTAELGSGIYVNNSSGGENNFVNNIIWGNVSVENDVQVNLSSGNQINQLKYCDIENGIESISNGEDAFSGLYLHNYDIVPGFINPTDSAGVNFDGLIANWNLSEMSPCQNSGIPDTTGLYLYPLDIVQNARIAVDTIDLGAHERQNVNYFVDFEFLESEMAPNITAANAHVDFNFVLRNSGIAVAPATTINFYISDNDTLDGQDIFYDMAFVPSMSRLQRDTLSVTTLLPDTIEIGYYYLIAKIDPNDGVVEKSETNNYIIKPVEIRNAVLNAIPSNMLLDHEQGSSGTASVYCSTGWSVRISVDWLVAEPKYGYYNGNFDLVADLNPFYPNRGTYVFIEANQEIYDSIYVVQSGSPPYIQIEQNSLSMKCYKGDSAQFNFGSSIYWDIETNADWLSAIPYSGSGSDTITLVTTIKNKTLSSRSTTVSVSGNGFSDNIIVRQDLTNMAQWALEDTLPGEQIVTDYNGNVYIARNYINPEGFGILATIYVTKYNTIGEKIWTISSNAIGGNRPKAISCDATNNIYLTGTFADSLVFGGQVVYGTSYYYGGLDAFVLKLSENGDVVWLKAYGNNDDNFLDKLSTNDTSSLYITGLFDENVQWGRYSAEGNLIWYNEIIGDADISGIVYDNSNDIYITGTYEGNIDFGDGVSVYGHPLNDNIYIADFDTSGTVKWVKTVLATAAGGNMSHLHTNDIAIDAQGNPVVIGTIMGNEFDFFDTIVTTSKAYFFVKLDSIGNRIISRFDGYYTNWNNQGSIQPESITVDSLNNTFISGCFNYDKKFGNGQDTLFCDSGLDGFFIKYDCNGDFEWVRGLSGPLSDRANQMTMDLWGNHYICGSYNEFVDLDTITLHTSEGSKYFLAKYGAQIKLKEKSNSNIYSCEGDSVQISVTAVGAAPFVYQWYFEDQTIQGATERLLVFDSIMANEEGRYFCIAENFNGIDTSGFFDLEVEVVPHITDQSASSTFCEGEFHNLHVFTNSANCNYKWWKNNILVPGANSNVLALGNVSLSDTGIYKCVAYNYCGSDTSSSMIIEVKLPLIIIEQSPNAEICEGVSVGFFINAEGSNPILYQWKKNGANIAGANDSVFYIPSITFEDEATYTCDVSNFCGTLVSEGIDLIVKTGPEIIGQTNDTLVCLADNITLEVLANGSGILGYQWFKDDILVPGNNSNMLFIENVEIADEGNFKCIVTNECSSDTSEIIQLNVLEPIDLISQSNDTSLCAGENTYMVILASGSGPLVFQWFFNSEPIPDATNDTLFINSVSGNNEGLYFCQVSNFCGVVESLDVNLSVVDLPLINEQPESASGCFGSDALFSVDATGTYIEYLWSKNGEPIPAANQNTLLLETISADDEGYYHCSVWNTCDSINSELAFLTVYDWPNVFLGNDTIIDDDSTLLLDAGQQFVEYLWQDNSTSQTYLLNAPDYELGSFLFWVVVTDTNLCQNSDSINVTIDNLTGKMDKFYEAVSISVYPNPTQGVFTLKLNSPVSELTYSIENVLGESIIQNSISLDSPDWVQGFNLTSYPNGIYYFKVYSEDRYTIKKIIKF